MAICCVICGTWYQDAAPDRLDICPECWTQNFAGSQDAPDAFDPRDPSARAQLEAFVDSSSQLTPRQVRVMTRLAASWRRSAGEED